MEKLKIGDEVEVLDPGLAMLRSICPDMPPNHLGRIHRIKNSIVYVEFPVDGSYEQSQIAPYPSQMIRVTATADPTTASEEV